MKVLVTGASGFIGSHMATHFQRFASVLTPDSRTLDLTDHIQVERYLRNHRPDIVLHCATWNATATSHRDTTQVLRQNLRMFFSLQRCREFYEQLIYFGSGAEFSREHWEGGMAESRFGTHVPSDDYGISKYAMEMSHGRQDPVWNLRLFGVYGPGEDWRIRFISQTCCRVLFDLPITVEMNRRFDYTWIGDVVEATQAVVERRPEPRTINVTAGQPHELVALARLVLAVAGKSLPIIVRNPGMGAEYSGDNSLMKQALPEIFFRSIEDGIADLYRWYSARRQFIDPSLL